MKKLIKKATAMITMLTMAATLAMTNGATAQAATVRLTGGCHVQNYGDRPIVSANAGNSILLGTTGKGLRLESYWLTISGMSGNIVYQSHVQNIGWTGWTSDYQFSGTRGRSLRVEAIELRLVSRNGGNQVTQQPVSSSYTQKVNTFFNDYYYRNGASWVSSKRPMMSAYSCSGCCAYVQIPQKLYAWCAEDDMCSEIQFLIDHKGLRLNDNNEKAYYSAPLWGNILSAAKDAMIVFYDLQYDSNHSVVDADFNFVARDEFNRTYKEL